MKPIHAVLLPAFVLAVALMPGLIYAQPAGYAVTQRGADWRVLSKTTVENGTNRLSQYTELATGLNYQNSYGQWTESQEQITLLPTGGAAATQGRHKVYFPADISNGVLEVVTPDGRHLKSRPLGVSYDDASNTVFIAELKHSVGYLTSSNTVTYRDAFEGIKADIVCTYRRGGFECDLVFRAQPPTPDTFGLDASFSTLQLVTEFFNTADPQEIPAQNDAWFGLQDTTLKFGKLTMTHGKAFAFKGTNSISPRPLGGAGQGEGAVAVCKSWVHLDGRTFLIESVPLLDISDNLDALPLTASVQKPAAGKLFALRSPSSALRLPAAHDIISDTNQILIASAGLNREPGVVLDYNMVDASQPDFQFQSGTTYYVNGGFNLTGTTTFSGDAVLKFDGNGLLNIDANGTVVCASTPDHPTIFTSFNDDSVGDQIDGSSGSPSILDAGGFLNIMCPSIVLSNICFFYGVWCIEANGADVDLWNCQFLPVDIAVADAGTVGLHNVLLQEVWDDSPISFANYAFAENVTLDCVSPWNYWPLGVNAATNCLFVYENNAVRQEIPFVPGGNVYVTTNERAYGSWVYSTESVFETAANAYHYLAAGSPYRSAGTTSISPALLAEFQTMTTYAPPDGGWPDINGTDLGFHYPVNEDSNFNGLPDWWELKYFGNYTHTGSELDSQGNTLLSYYQNSTDPSAIQFWLSITNIYLSTNQTSVRVNLQAGWPFYVAVLVNDTNYADANWQPYTGTNIAVTLGTNDGKYNVWVGLRGWPTNAQPTWDTGDITFARDQMRPALTVTNPIVVSGAATVIKPYLQLQGCGDENLLSVSYDITNALGVFTNLDGFVTDKFFDTNKFNFTTNFFQCYDMALTNGLNLITLHVTDLAGNTTTTNILITLDYSTATNPPVVTLIWPQDGMAVSGTNITIRGTMSDETGTVMAQVINGDGTTNVINGIVERNGMFWLENVPLNGTNAVSVQAVDAAGNMTTTNFTIMPTSLTLTIDSTPMGDALYQAFGSLSGTVSDPSATVTVNGVTAMVEGGGNWSADNVPVYGRGTATFDAQASASGLTANASSAVEMGPYVAIVEYHISKESRRYDSSGSNILDVIDQKDYSAKVQPDGKGNWQQTYTGTLHDDYFYFCGGYHDITDVKWSETNSGTYVETTEGGYIITGTVQGYTGVGNYYGPSEIESVPDEDVDAIISDFGYVFYDYHYFAAGVDWTLTNRMTEIKIDDAHTQVKLYTGGKAGVKRQNLFGISVTAGGYGEPLDPWDGYPWHETAGEPIDITSTTVMGKHPGADGMVWKVLPDGFEGQDMTVTAPAKHYDAGASPTKYKSHFEVFVDQPWPNYPYDVFHNDPNDPFYDPQPIGYPFYRIGVNGGHAWWKLTTDAPIDVVNQFIASKSFLPANCAQFLGVEVGYGATVGLDWLNAILTGYAPTAPGELPWPNTHSPTIHRTYAVGFLNMISGLSYTENLHDNPGTYDLKNNNCATETGQAGKASGVALPSEWLPEIFGFGLPLDDP